MAIIIPNMDMPKSCADCDFSCPKNGYEFYCCVDLKDVDLSNSRTDCPLVSAEDMIAEIEAAVPWNIEEKAMKAACISIIRKYTEEK